ncbi:MAG: FimV/HubP family polar landmark protein, partial [Neisseria sp.]|nr:FimV/HubP family polar landmark protein [Neisseria sp.]
PAAPAPESAKAAAEPEVSLDVPVAEEADEVLDVPFEEVQPVSAVMEETVPAGMKGFAAADELNVVEETIEVVAHHTPPPLRTAEEKALDLAVEEEMPVAESLTAEEDIPPPVAPAAVSAPPARPAPVAEAAVSAPAARPARPVAEAVPPQPVPAATAAVSDDDWLEEGASNVVFDDADDAEDLDIEWGELGASDTKNAQPAFVSESVGMTAPLEAKYELAEMYIEIGDPEAAHETLMELLEESQGEILTKSRALLARLNV